MTDLKKQCSFWQTKDSSGALICDLEPDALRIRMRR